MVFKAMIYSTKQQLPTLDAMQYSEYIREPPRLLQCVWEASLKTNLIDRDAGIFSLCCCLSLSEW